MSKRARLRYFYELMRDYESNKRMHIFWLFNEELSRL